MSSNIADTLIRVVSRAIHLLADDEAVVTDLHELTAVLRQGLFVQQSEQESDAAEEQEEALPCSPPSNNGAAQSPHDEPLEETTTDAIEQAEVEVGLTAELPPQQRNEEQSLRRPPAIVPISDEDLPAIEDRCRLKAEAVRWTIERKALLDRGADFQVEIAPIGRELIRQGKEKNCLLWMLLPTWRNPNDLHLMADVEKCFVAVADSLLIMRTILSESSVSEFFGKAAQYLAEAQSALRVAVGQINERYDQDQHAVFSWLRIVTDERQVRVSRHMRIDDPADPALADILLARIQALSVEVDGRKHVAHERSRLLNKLEYLAKQIAQDGSDHVQYQDAFSVTIDDLISVGVPPSNKQIRQTLLPVMDKLNAESATGGLAQVLHEYRRVVTSRHGAPISRPKRPVTPDIKNLRPLLRNKAVVLVGGHKRNHANKKLERALKLARLEWISTSKHQPINDFRAAIVKPDVAVVLLPVRFSSHSFGELQNICEEHGKLLVRLPTGYNPNQVAMQIVQQCGDRLVAQATAARS